MSRPKPKVILEHANKDTFKIEQILESDAIWAVFYKGEPFNLKSGSLVAAIPVLNTKRFHLAIPAMHTILQKNLIDFSRLKTLQFINSVKAKR